jgi:choline dehydrogenase
MRSGIGPAEELTSLGIDVVADAPGVGAHLVEQPIFTAVYAGDPAKLTEGTPPVQTMLTVAEPGSAGRAWLHVFPTTFAPGEMSPSGVAFEMNVGLLKPRSRGRVTLVSRDPKVPPRIDVNLLADPWDVASMVEGIRLARRLASTEPLASLHRGEVSRGDAVGDDEDALTAVLKAGVSFITTPTAPFAWAREAIRRPSWTRRVLCEASPASAWPTRRSCRRHHPTPRR